MWVEFYSHLPAYENGTKCSETSAYKLQTPGNYPKESIQHTEHSESLKSRIFIFIMRIRIVWYVYNCNYSDLTVKTGYPNQALQETQDARRKYGRTNFTLRVKEQALRLTFRVHDDDNDLLKHIWTPRSHSKCRFTPGKEIRYQL